MNDKSRTNYEKQVDREKLAKIFNCNCEHCYGRQNAIADFIVSEKAQADQSGFKRGVEEAIKIACEEGNYTEEKYDPVCVAIRSLIGKEK